MARRRKGREINGILLVNKASGHSSNQVVQKVKRLFVAQKAGHTGALDPLATGMLPVCLGEATKFSQYSLDADKTYTVLAEFGIRTDTSDADGEIVEKQPVEFSYEELTQAIQTFIGTQEQTPSIYSALKFEGRPLYYYARKGIEVPRPTRTINVYDIQLNRYENTLAEMTIHCSKGTYIRTIVDDLGQMLGCGAYVKKLHRDSVAGLENKKMAELDAISDDSVDKLDQRLLPMDSLVQHLPKVVIDDDSNVRFKNGNDIPFVYTQDKEVRNTVDIGTDIRVYDSRQRFLGMALITANQRLQPKRLVVYNDEEGNG